MKLFITIKKDMRQVKITNDKTNATVPVHQEVATELKLAMAPLLLKKYQTCGRGLGANTIKDN